MFGLFKKKQKVAAPVAPAVLTEEFSDVDPVAPDGPPIITESIKTWHTEIESNRQEFSVKLQTAISDSGPVIESMESDLSVLGEVWNPVERSLDAAKQELTHAWNRAKSALARDHAVTDQQRDEADLRYDVETTELEIDFEEAYRASRARAANALMQTALHSDARARFCTGCSQPLVSFLIGQTENITCSGCGAGQTVDPGQAFRMFAASAALWVGEWDGFAFWRTMIRAQVLIKDYRNTSDVPMPLLHEFHDSASQYWQTVFGVEAQLVPQGAPHIPRKVEARMKEVYRLLRQHWQWREIEAEA